LDKIATYYLKYIDAENAGKPVDYLPEYSKYFPTSLTPSTLGPLISLVVFELLPAGGATGLGPTDPAPAVSTIFIHLPQKILTMLR
ncbi:MAG: hypothetical protein JW873_06870, partial [Candidatus Saganbacteria bacterium]|nr:hypothetical protein [Candidatus Saganbacteria bacterium]